jgi:NhaP-type Na+/H+ and K+/H+ antiporter
MTAFGALVGGGDMPAAGAVALLVVALVVGGALIARRIGPLRPPVQAALVLAGFALGHGGLGALSLDYRGDAVADVTAAALIVLLAGAGMALGGNLLRRPWRELLVVAPLTAVLVAVAARILFGMAWTEAFLLGAVLAPIGPRACLGGDATAAARPLQIESAAGAAFALPVVIALATAARPDIGFDWARVVFGELGLGLLTGVVVGLAASLALPRAEPRVGAPEALGALAGLAAYLVAIPLGHANGFVAVLACAVTIGARRAHVSEPPPAREGDGSDLAVAGILVVYGSLLTRHRMTHADWQGMALVVVMLVAIRPLAVLAALRRDGPDDRVTAFLAWYGPRGALAMAMALAVVGSPIPASDNLFNVAAPVILASVLAHGLTAALAASGRLPFAQWPGSRNER